MNRLYFKLFAALTMVIDHIAVIFLDSETFSYSILRAIGRIAFVMFAYMIAEGFHKTKDISKYLLRLGIFALVIEVFIIAYYFVSDINMIITFNIFWTLFFGLLTLYLVFHKNPYLKILIIPIVFGSEIIGLSYGSYGILMIAFFGVYTNKVTNFLHLVFLNLIYIDKPLLDFAGFAEYAKFPAIQWFSVVAIIFIFVYNGSFGKYRFKWFFYLFYPGHLLVLYVINLLL